MILVLDMYCCLERPLYPTIMSFPTSAEYKVGLRFVVLQHKARKLLTLDSTSVFCCYINVINCLVFNHSRNTRFHYEVN